MPTKKKTKKKAAKTRAKVKVRAVKKKAAKAKARSQKPVAKKRTGKPKKQLRKRKRTRTVEPVSFSVEKRASRSGRSGQLSGDLQGLSRSEGADSESVAELLDEGNPFEAEVVSGVEAAGTDEKEVRTHEVPEDDVPGEYLDKD